jgi:signal peptidase I
MEDIVDSPKAAPRGHMTGFRKFRKEWLEPILIAVILVTIIKVFFFQNFKIPSGSMEDTLLVGDYLFANKFLYGTRVPFTNTFFWKIRDPKPGDIIVFRSVEEKKDLIKRCVAVGGQTLEIRNAQVYVNGVLQPLPPHGKITDSAIYPGDMSPRDNLGPIQVPPGTLFMMGDNRDNSYDSRFWKFLPMENVKGKALFLYWSWDPTTPLFDVAHKVRWNRILTAIR